MAVLFSCLSSCVPFLRTRALVGVVVLSCACTSASAFPWDNSGEKLDPRDSAFAPVAITPVQGGVQWGTPLDGGPLRVMFIAPRFALRDVAELAHRLEMKVENIALWDSTHFGRPDPYPRAIPGTSAEEVSKELRNRLDQKLDVIVAANFDFSILPPDDFQAMAEKVRGGAGLVLAHHRHTLPDNLKAFLDELQLDPSGETVTQGIGERMTAEWMSGLGFVQCGTIGAGRVVEIDYQGAWPATHCLIPTLANPLLAEPEDFDTYLSLAARATRWAGGRNVPVSIAAVASKALPEPEELQIPPGLEEMAEANLPAGASLFHPYSLQLAAPADRTYVVRAAVRQRGRGQAPVTITYTRNPLRKGAQTYDFTLVAGAGDYWIDIWLLDGEKVVEWFSEAITIEAWPSIADLTLNKTSVLPQDSIGITFTMPARKRPCIALARATDALGRIVAERHQAIAADTALVPPIGLGFADLISGMLKIEVFVSDRDMPAMPDWDTRVCAYAYKYVPVRRQIQADKFDVVSDVTADVEFNAREIYRGLQKAGIDTAAFPCTEESIRFIAKLGLQPLPEVTSYTPYQPAGSVVRSPCLNDPNFILSEQTHLKSMAQIVRDYSYMAISLGENNALSATGEDLCRCPNCARGFGEYLHKMYSDLDVLNRVWGTSYESWDAIVPATEQAARESGRFAPWIDFRLYMDSVFLSTHTSARAAIRAADMRARSGISTRGLDELFSGVEWTALASNLDMIATPADARIVDMMRSARPPASLAGIMIPADVSAEQLRRLPWFAVFHRAQWVWWPNVCGSTIEVPTIVGVDALGNPTPFAPEFFGETAALQGGLATLLLKSTPLKPEIAIYSGRSSAWLNEIDNQFEIGSADAERAFASVLKKLGYAFDFVTAARIEKGGLTNYQVLILPMARSLSDAEVAAIRSFVASGGTLVADVAPGVFNQHGVLRDAPFADAFGVRYAKSSSASAPTSALVELTIGGAKTSGDLAGVRADAGVEVNGAQVGGLAGSTPVWLLRADKPFALLINHAIDSEALDKASGILDEFLRNAGVQHVIDVNLRKGKRFQGERFVSTFGAARIVGLLADADSSEETQKLRMRFERSDHVYDMRAKLPVMRPANVDVELAQGAAALFSVLPYDVLACTVTAPPSSLIGARLPVHVALETKGGVAGEHLVRIEVHAITTEKAIPLPHYSQEIVCAKGEGDAFIPFALNDPLTRYRIVARDLLSGVSGEAFVNLSKVKRT